VVCGGLYWISGRCLLLSAHQWVRWVPIRRRRDAFVIMGDSRLQFTSLSRTHSFVAPPNILPSPLWGLFLHRNCHFQIIRRILLLQPDRSLDNLHPLPTYLRSHLHHLPTSLGLPYFGRPVAYR
jgi:hypothetical protein